MVEMNIGTNMKLTSIGSNTDDTVRKHVKKPYVQKCAIVRVSI